MIYIVEGYNKNDYISEIVNWEILQIFSNKEDAENYISNIKDYICRINESEVIPYLEKPLEYAHWEIYTGV